MVNNPPQISGPWASLSNQSNIQTPIYQQPMLEGILKELEALRNENQAIKEENQEMRKIISSLQPKKKNIPETAGQQENDVTEETAWIVQRHKKRKLTEIPVKENLNRKQKQVEAKQKKPPPVVVSNINNYNLLNQEIKNLKLNHKTTMMNNNQVKINVDTELEYRSLTKFMNEKSQEWHTYENKLIRPIRVMARHLHPSCQPEEIKSEIQQMGYNILDVVNKYKKETNKEGKIVLKPLPLFMLTFHNEEDINKIYEIRYLCHMKVQIEALRNNKMIPQCKKCQRFGHTQKFCAHTPKCVKCAGEHLTVHCQKQSEEKPKCSNCGKDHPASYRGCIVAKELQKRRQLLTKSKNTQNSQPRQFTSRQITEGISYAQASLTKNNRVQQTQDEQPSLTQMMQLLLTKFETQENMIKSLADRVTRLENRNNGASASKNMQ